jgi:hypothetical protein
MKELDRIILDVLERSLYHALSGTTIFSTLHLNIALKNVAVNPSTNLFAIVR